MFPGKNLFDIIEICFGKLVGKGIILLFIWYALYSLELSLLDYSYFVNTVAFPETPKIIIHMIFVILIIWIVKGGIEVLGRWSKFFLPIPIILIFTSSLLLIPQMNIDNIRPVLNNDIDSILKATYYTYVFPFADIVFFSIVLSSFKTKQSPYKIYIFSLLIAGIVVLVTGVVNILTIGVDMISSTYFPSYLTVSKINVGNVLQRIEVMVSISFFLGGFIKLSIELLVACKGFAKIFVCEDYRFITIPISLIPLNFSYYEFDSIMYYFGHALEIYPYITLPFQVIFPISILVVTVIKKKKLGAN